MTFFLINALGTAVLARSESVAELVTLVLVLVGANGATAALAWAFAPSGQAAGERRPLQLLLLGLGIMGAVGLAEGFLRFMSHRRLAAGRAILVPDEELGWKSPAAARRSDHLPGFGRVEFATVRHGFKLWTEDRVGRPTALVIGDSFTQAAQVSTGTEYFHELQRQFPEFAWYAYGCGGYGTLQELLTLDRFGREIAPALILWQFCGNDFVDNLHDIERDSIMFQPHSVRPYWEDGHIVHRFTRRCSAPLEFLVTHSRVAHALMVSYDQLLRRYDPHLSVEFRLPPELLNTSAGVTGILLQKAKAAFPHARFLLFSVDDNDRIQAVCRDAGIEFIDGVKARLDEARHHGTKVDGLPHDGHWNTEGHRIVGRFLAEKLTRTFSKPEP